MRAFFVGLLSIGLLDLASGCAGASIDDTSANEAAVTDGACFAAGSTEARARCLTEQASALIDTQIARAEDPRDKALLAFKGKLRVPAETGCFTDDVGGGLMGLVQNDIDSERDVEQVAIELKAAVEFLKFYYRDLDGYPNHFFESVEICPRGQVGGDLVLTGSRLRIGMGTGYGGHFTVQTSTNLRDAWSAGPLALLAGPRWAIVDPVGVPRVALRKALAGIVLRLKTRLDAVADAPEQELRAELLRVARDETSSTLRDRALERIAALPPADLTKLAKNWSRELARPEIAEGSEEGAVTMSDVLNNKNVKVTVAQAGLVNVQNVHQISVDVDAFLPLAKTFTRYVDTVETETTVTVNQIGVVNVQTNDVISVRVQVLFEKAAQTASLERALD